MGKRYYCDYCDKTMSSTPTIIKTHNQGLVHQKLTQDHYQQFKDPETILSEESIKRPCLRFSKGECQFGSICRFSHYTRDQIQWFQNYVSHKNRARSQYNQPSFSDLYSELQNNKCQNDNQFKDNTVLYSSDGVTHVFPWKYNSEFDSLNLPPSLKRFTIDDFIEANVTEWG